MNTQERTLPNAVVILFAITIAIGAIVAAVLLLGGNQALGEGDDSPTECSNADETGVSTPFTAPSGEIVTGVCIKAGNDTFAGGLKHSGLITVDGTYGDNDCFVVSGIGTSQVSVTVNCKSVSHLDVNTGPETTPTPTPTPTTTTTTPTPTPAVLAATATPTPTPAVLAAVQEPEALPVSGGAPAEGSNANLALLLGLGGLALLSGTGTLVAAKVRRRR